MALVGEVREAGKVSSTIQDNGSKGESIRGEFV